MVYKIDLRLKTHNCSQEGFGTEKNVFERCRADGLLSFFTEALWLTWLWLKAALFSGLEIDSTVKLLVEIPVTNTIPLFMHHAVHGSKKKQSTQLKDGLR